MEEQTTKQYDNTQPVEGFPEFITETNDGDYKVIMKDGKEFFILQDLPYKKIRSIKRLLSRNGTKEISEDDFSRSLLSHACMHPKITEEQIDEMKSSKIFRLNSAIQRIYDLNSLL